MDALLILAIAPAAVLIFYFYIRDRYEPEPQGLVFRIFLIGFFSIIPAAILEKLGDFILPAYAPTTKIAISFTYTFFVVGISEEFCKYLTVRLFVYNNKEFNEPYDGILYAVAASLGFATSENILYVMQGGVGVGVVRAVLSVPAHALFGATIGYFLGIAKFSKKGVIEISFQLIGFLFAAFMHGVYDFFVLSNQILLILLVLPLMGLMWGLGHIYIWHALSLSPFKRIFTKAIPVLPSKPTSSSVEQTGPPLNVAKARITLHSIHFCPLCGNSVKDSFSFCPYCGHKLV